MKSFRELMEEERQRIIQEPLDMTKFTGVYRWKCSRCRETYEERFVPWNFVPFRAVGAIGWRVRSTRWTVKHWLRHR